MRPRQIGVPVDLRSFRWTLAPVEHRLDGQVEGARLALARLQQQCRVVDEAEHLRAAQRGEQEARARETAGRDLRAAALETRHLARLEEQRLAAEAVRTELAQRIAAARIACAERQRQLESLQALRLDAQRAHARAQQSREARQADAAWLAMAELRRAHAARDAGETE